MNLYPDEHPLYVKKYISTVYSTVASLCLSFCLGIIFSSLIEGISSGLNYLMIAGTFMLLILAKQSGKLIHTYLFAISFGLMNGPFLQYIYVYDKVILVNAGIGSIIIFLSMSYISYKSKNLSSNKLNSTLIITLNLTVYCGFLMIFYSNSIFSYLYTYIGLLCFSLFTIHDIDMIIKRAYERLDSFYKLSEREIVDDSIDLLLNYINIFMKLVVILRDRPKKKLN